jgi:hypothetical protein
MKLFTTVVFLFASVLSFAQSAEEEAIKKTIQESYIDGLQNGGTPEQIRKGFDPTFALLRVMDNQVKPYPLEEWIAAIEKRKKENPVTGPKTEGKFLSVDITGTAAVVKLELYREGKRTFTDYLALYKFTEGWRIVSKTFFRHP